MLLNKDQILKALDLPFRDVDVPEWGGKVRVSTMTAAARDSFEQSIYETIDGKPVLKHENFRAKLLSRALVDENGERLFGEDDFDVEALGAKSAKIIQQLFDIAQELNGTSKAAQDAIEKK